MQLSGESENWRRDREKKIRRWGKIDKIWYYWFWLNLRNSGRSQGESKFPAEENDATCSGKKMFKQKIFSFDNSSALFPFCRAAKNTFSENFNLIAHSFFSSESFLNFFPLYDVFENFTKTFFFSAHSYAGQWV